jgi:hypothetical protein
LGALGTLCNRQSAIGNRQSAIGNRQLEYGFRFNLDEHLGIDEA